MEEILNELGALTWWNGSDLYLDCSRADRTEVPGDKTGKMRSSVILLGAMLGRNKKGLMGYPGGCVIGRRPIDLHLYVLREMGASLAAGEGYISAVCSRLAGDRNPVSEKQCGRYRTGDPGRCSGRRRDGPLPMRL